MTKKNNGSLKVIIADDNEQNLYLLEVMLKNEKFEVIKAENGKEVLQYLKKDKYDLIISDILMPVLDGFQLCRKCKTDPLLKNIPFIFYTATYINDQDKDFALSLGADRFIIKPAEPVEFIKIIKDVIHQYAKGNLQVQTSRINDEKIYFMEYSMRLSDKLENKILKLEEVNKSLKQSEERYRLVINKSLDAIAVIQDGRFKFVNPAMEELTGFSASELYNSPITKYIHKDFQREVTELFEKTKKSENNPKNHDYKIRTKNDKILWLESIENQIIWEEKPAIISFIRNITEKKEIEGEIKKINSELEQKVAERTAELVESNKEMESFSYSVSHDLRAPLRSIEGFSNMLFEEYSDKLDKEGQDIINRIRNSTKLMGNLIEDLLSLSKTSRYEINYQIINLTNLVNSILSEIKKTNTDRKIEITIHKVPEAESDMNMLSIALTNLIGNAWKFTEKKSDPKIEFGFTRDKNEIVYFIKDNGAGFDMTHSDKLFGAFQRLHTQKEFPGTGIGLALVKRIFNRLGGRIWFDAKEGKGATFYFVLPKKNSK